MAVEVTAGVESITHVKLTYQVLLWLRQGSPVPGPLWPGRQPSACQQRESIECLRPALASLLPREGTRQSGAARSLRREAQPQAVPRAKRLQFLQSGASRERGFSQREVRKKMRKATGRALKPWGPGGRGGNSCQR